MRGIAIAAILGLLGGCASQETAVLPRARTVVSVPAKSVEERIAELEEIYKKTSWGYSERPTGLYVDAPKIAGYGDVAVPVSVRYLVEGNLSQTKTAMKALLRLKDNVGPEHIDEIVGEYLRLGDEWTKNEMKKTVEAVLRSNAGAAAGKGVELLGSEDKGQRNIGAEILGYSFIPADEYFDDILAAYKGETDEKLKERIAYGVLGKMFRRRKDLAQKALDGDDDMLRVAAIISMPDLDERLDYILNTIKNSKESMDFKQMAMEHGFKSYITEEYNARRNSSQAELPIDQYERMIRELKALSDEKPNDIYESIIRIWYTMQLTSYRLVSDEVRTVKEYDSGGRIRSITTYRDLLPGECMRDHLVVLYYQRAERYLLARDRENAEKDLYRGMVLAQDVPAKDREKVFKYLPRLRASARKMLEGFREKEEDKGVREMLDEGIRYIEGDRR
jgi:hypothetical protein